MRQRSLLDKLIYPEWFLHARDVIDAWGESNRQFNEWAKSEVARLQNARPPEQGIDPFIPEGGRS